MNGNIKLIYAPADRDCLSHTIIKSHQMTKKTKPYGNELQKDKPEWFILKEDLKTHFEKKL